MSSLGALELHAKALLANSLSRTNLPDLEGRAEGKVRDVYSMGGDELLMITTDRASAFDHVWGTIPLKGQLLNRCAAWWFEHTKDIIENHVIDVPDPNVMLVRKCKPLPVEVVVRGYLTGTTETSIWTHYKNGSRIFCGHKLAEGMKKHQKLPKPLVTPSTKAEKGGHDHSVAREVLVAGGVISSRDFDFIAQKALALFERGQELCAARGLILVDTKYEFGRDESGNIVLIDEVHTPDSSRYWYAGTYHTAFSSGGDPEALDKDFLRRWLRYEKWVEGGPKSDRPLPDEIRLEAAKRYLLACETICGPIDLDLSSPSARISRAFGTLSGRP